MAEPAVETETIKQPLDEQIAAVFDRSVDNYKKDKLIIKTYEQKFQQLVDQLPADRQDDVMIKLQKIGMTIRGIFNEYGARFTDFVRNIVVWPMVKAVPDFPKDKYYQVQLARAKAWTGFAKDTVPTATSERLGYRDHFLPSVVTQAQAGALFSTFWAIPFGVAVGATEGAKYGLAAGLGGVAAGAGLGAIIGGGSTLIMRLKDRMIGPPIAYYNLDHYSGTTVVSSGSSGSSSGMELNSGSDWQNA